MEPLMAVGPVDGRYRRRSGEKLAPWFSEFGLIKHRLLVMVEYLIALSEHLAVPLRRFTKEEKTLLRRLAELRLRDAKVIQAIETKGYGRHKKTDHDVKACELWLRDMLADTSLADALEWIHFGLTSEDVNNLAYALMLREAIQARIEPALRAVHEKLRQHALLYADLPMLSRTHGQPASPTTLGKEANVFASRLGRQLNKLRGFVLLAKLNGASGNYNAHQIALPTVDWIAFSRAFIARLNDPRKIIRFEVNLVTTQIEPHDTYAELFQLLARIGSILVDLCQDEWRYISDDWLVQVPVKGATGSSTMPHKVNPISFENAEGNLEVAGALFELFARKLTRSRLQRDLSDSTVERNFGYALGLCLISYGSILRGLDSVFASQSKIAEALGNEPAVVTEAYQTILRREGFSSAYATLKDFARGRRITLEDLRDFVARLRVSRKLKQELLAVLPTNYIGLAPKLARM